MDNEMHCSVDIKYRLRRQQRSAAARLETAADTLPGPAGSPLLSGRRRSGECLRLRSVGHLRHAGG